MRSLVKNILWLSQVFSLAHLWEEHHGKSKSLRFFLYMKEFIFSLSYQTLEKFDKVLSPKTLVLITNLLLLDPNFLLKATFALCLVAKTCTCSHMHAPTNTRKKTERDAPYLQFDFQAIQTVNSLLHRQNFWAYITWTGWSSVLHRYDFTFQERICLQVKTGVISRYSEKTWECWVNIFSK